MVKETDQYYYERQRIEKSKKFTMYKTNNKKETFSLLFALSNGWILSQILHWNGYVFSAKTTSDFIIYSCVAFSFAFMSKASDFPILQVASDNLGVAS